MILNNIEITPDQITRTVDLDTQEVVETTTYIPYTNPPTQKRITMQKILDDRTILTNQTTDIATADTSLEEVWNYGMDNGLVDPRI